MQIKYIKLDAGLYEMHVDGERAGVVGKSVDGRWTASDSNTGAGTVFHATRKAAAEALIQERAEILAEIAAAKSIIDIVDAQNAAEEQKEEMQARIDEKIQPLPNNSRMEPGRMWIGNYMYNLEGSKQLDFMEFMFLYSYESVWDHITFDKQCEYAAADGDGELSADSYADNYVDCWSDYIKAWEKANTYTCKQCQEPHEKHSTSEQSGLCIQCEADSVKEESEIEKCRACDGKGFNEEDFTRCEDCAGMGHEEQPEPLPEDEEVSELSEIKRFSKTLFPFEIITNVERAMYEIRESGEVHADDPHLVEMIEERLDQMDIEYTTVKLAHNFVPFTAIYKIEQDS